MVEYVLNIKEDAVDKIFTKLRITLYFTIRNINVTNFLSLDYGWYHHNVLSHLILLLNFHFFRKRKIILASVTYCSVNDHICVKFGFIIRSTNHKAATQVLALTLVPALIF